MHRIILAILIFNLCVDFTFAQEEETCSQLGVWLWHFEDTGQPNHNNLARTIESMGASRIYVKVADGGVNPSRWPELIDTDLVSTYKTNDVSPWAWSYNYQGNVDAQGEALYEAAKTGYEGYVIDIEMEFDGEDETLEALMQSFYIYRNRAIADGYASPDFPLYVTTWGNPILHNYRIDIIDKYVDGFMPQTYIEEWGGDHLSLIEACIAEGNNEYESLGATKPIHHILSTAQQIVSADDITNFIKLSGPETSLWRIPGGGVSQQVWDRWRDVNWDIDFCQSVATIENKFSPISIYPNPATDQITVSINDLDNQTTVFIYDQVGKEVYYAQPLDQEIDISILPAGIYNVVVEQAESRHHLRFIKL